MGSRIEMVTKTIGEVMFGGCLVCRKPLQEAVLEFWLIRLESTDGVLQCLCGGGPSNRVRVKKGFNELLG
jgi:hypothetical protein